MAATLFDKVLPPIVFLTALLAAFIVIVSAMNPTIESNRQQYNTALSIPGVPDFERIMFPNYTETFLTPNPYTVSLADRVTTFPVIPNDKWITFSTPAEPDHQVKLAVVGKRMGELFGDRHEMFFHQHGGWGGVQEYGCWVGPEAFGAVLYSNGSHAVYKATIKLRHVYEVYVTNGPGDTGGGATINDDYMAYNYNITVAYANNATGVSAWSIVAGLFTFNLPGVPFYITALIMGPIYVTIAMTAYIVVRSAFPM